MCGIVGYIGDKEAQPILMDCLLHLEYRGYDSCGIAVDGEHIEVCKDAVRVAELKHLSPDFSGFSGIGHTRWATHGAPSKMNAHPHCNTAGNISVVHNGIIENYEPLRRRLVDAGHKLISETDTEVIPHLIEEYYNGDIVEAFTRALEEIRGSYAVILLCHGENRLLAARVDSPLAIGIGDRETFIASDVPALIGYTNRIIYPEDGDICVIYPDKVEIMRSGNIVERQEQLVSWSVEDARKGGYDHFMLKEIYEQPKVIRDAVGSFLTESGNTAGQLSLPQGVNNLLLLACGTSYHAALVAKFVGEVMLEIPIRVELASEFCRQMKPLPGEINIVISQSGETADIIKSVKYLKSAGHKVIAITNVVASSVSRLADHTLYTQAGPEISVAATKSFIAQLITLYQLLINNSVYQERRLDELRSELRQLSSRIQLVLSDTSVIKYCAEILSRYEHVFVIGRGINYPIALEGALKIKEISYIHAEGYAGGELKHGSFALLSNEFPVIALVPHDSTYEPMLTTIKEIRSRSSPIIAVTVQGDDQVATLADNVITIPEVSSIFSPLLNIVILQLLAYYTARNRGCAIDFPRNLAKSVTVE